MTQKIHQILCLLRPSHRDLFEQDRPPRHCWNYILSLTRNKIHQPISGPVPLKGHWWKDTSLVRHARQSDKVLRFQHPSKDFELSFQRTVPRCPKRFTRHLPEQISFEEVHWDGQIWELNHHAERAPLHHLPGQLTPVHSWCSTSYLVSTPLLWATSQSKDLKLHLASRKVGKTNFSNFNVYFFQNHNQMRGDARHDRSQIPATLSCTAGFVWHLKGFLGSQLHPRIASDGILNSWAL